VPDTAWTHEHLVAAGFTPPSVDAFLTSGNPAVLHHPGRYPVTLSGGDEDELARYHDERAAAQRSLGWPAATGHQTWPTWRVCPWCYAERINTQLAIPTPDDCAAPHDSPSGCPYCGWDGVHETRVQRRGPAERGACTCGWHGGERTGLDMRWQAVADTDEHVDGVE
jgi:hypothetical protein